MQIISKTVLLIVVFDFFLAEGYAAPADLTWNGTVSNNMSVPGNWTPAQEPNVDGANDNLTFPSGPSTSVTNDIAGTLLIGNISIASNYTISGNAFGINAPTPSYLGSYTLTFSSTNGVINVPVNLNGTWAVTSTAGAGNAINGAINGGTTGNLYLQNGVLKLGASNTYGGVLTIGNEVPLMSSPAAYLQATAANAFGNAGYNTVVTVSSTATLDLNNFSSGVGTLGGPVGSSVKLGSGTLSVNSGSAQVPFYGTISGGGNVSVNTNGLALMGDNTYTGTTTIQLGGHLASLDIDIGMTSGVIFGSGGGTLVVGQSGTSSKNYTLNDAGTIGVPGPYTLTLSGTLMGSSSFIKNGPGTLVLQGTNSNAGNIHLWGGILNIESLGSATGFTFDSPSSGIGTLQIGSGSISTISLPFDLSLPGFIDTNGYDITINAAISGGNFLVKTGAGTLTLPFIGNEINAKTKISEGILNVSYNGYHTVTQTVFYGLGTGTLQISENFTTTEMKAFAKPIVFMADGTIDTQTFDMDATGVIAGLSDYTFNKVGTGTLTLSGANIYQGPTHVMAGTLKAGIATGNSGAFGEDSAITIDDGATLDFSTFANSVGSLDNSGTVSSKATMTATSTTTSFTQASTGTLLLDFPNSAGTPYGNLTAPGAIVLDGTLTVTNTGSYTPPSSVKEIILLQSTGSGKQLSGAFSTISPLPSQFASVGKVQYDYSDNLVYIGLSSSCTGDWTSTSSPGNWANTANWDGACAPGVGSQASDHDAATFPDVAAGAVTVTLATSDGSAPQSVTLHNINFESTSTTYTIQQFSSASQIILDKSTTSATKALISMSATAATINAPIVLNTDSRISLSSGTLTLGASTTVTGSTSTLYISEGTTTGALINGGSLSPMAINIEGGTIQNNGTVTPSGALTIAGISGIASPLTLTNASTITAGTTLTIGGAGGDTAIINTGTMTSTGAFAMNTGTFANDSGGHVNAAAGQTLTLTGGTFTNANGAFLGLSTANITLSGGTLNTSDEVLAKNYSQDSTSTLQLDFPTSSETPRGMISAAGKISLTGTLDVLNTGMFVPPSSGEIILLSSSGTGKQLSGAFSTTNLDPSFSQGKVINDYSENTTYLTFSSCNGVWQSTSNGTWGNTSNWVGGCAPGVGSMAADHDLAQFNDVAAASITVTLANSGGGSAQSVTLHDIIFDTSSTEYTIQQFDGTSQIILDADMGISKPRISALSGTATINAPIVLNADSRIYLGGGNLTFGSSTSLTSTSNTLYISEGTTASTLINNGSIAPADLIIEGGIVNNANIIHPTGSITIGGLEGIETPLIVTNTGSMIAGTTFTVGGTVGGASVENNGTMQSTGLFQILSDTLTNNSGATLGTSSAPLTVSGGKLITSGQVSASTYTQSGSGTLQFNITSSLHVTVADQANLGSSPVIVNASGNVTSGPTQIILMTADGGVVGKFGPLPTYLNFPSNLIPNLLYPGNSVVLDVQKSVPSHFTSTSSQIVFTSIAQHTSLISRKAFQMAQRMAKPSSPLARAASIPEEELLAQNETLLADSGELLAQRAPVRKGENLASRVQKKKQADVWNVYVGPVASFGHVDTVQDQIGFGYQSAGALAGFDTILPTSEDDSLSAGIGSLVEYRYLWGNAKEHAGSFTSDKLHASVYGTLVPKAAPELSIDWILGFAYTWDSLNRNVGPDLSYKAKGNTNEIIGSGFVGEEYTFSWKHVSLTQFLHLQYAYDHIHGFTEKGAGVYDLKVKHQNLQSLTTSLGLRFDTYYSSSYVDFVFEVDAEWVYEYLNQSRSVYFTPFVVTSIPTVISTVEAPRNSGLVALDLLTTFPGKWQVEANSTLFFNKMGYDLFFFLTLGKLF